jgi:hypothetical protein
MYSKLTEEELEFMQVFYNPKCAIECLFSDGTPRNWNDGGQCITLRNYQIPFLGYDSVIEDDEKLTDLENFRRRIAVGTRIITSGRKIGKTFIALIANILLKLIYYKDKEMTMSSYDEKHVSKIMDEIRSFLCSHNFFKSYKERIRGNPEYEIETKNGNKLYGINETIKGKNPGENFWGHHTYINFADEIQAETEEAYNKKIDAVSDFGVMEILCGITLISKNSPLGRIMRDKENKNNLIRLPQYVSHLFDEKTKRDRIRSYGGEQCFDEQTEIFTNNGWKNIGNIKNTDKVLSLDINNNSTVYCPIKNIFINNFEGYLNSYQSHKVNFLVTDNHSMIFKTIKKDYRIDTIKNIMNYKTDRTSKKWNTYPINKFYLRQDVHYLGKEKKSIKIKGNWLRGCLKTHEFDMNDWLEFLGWFVSEGCVYEYKHLRPWKFTSYRIQIAQTKTQYLEEIKKLIQKMGFGGYYGQGTYYFTNKIIGEHLIKHCGKYARNKKIPEYVKNLSKTQLNIFLNAFNKGDGDGKRKLYYTTSSALSNDLQELILKVGKIPTIYKNKQGLYVIQERNPEAPKIYIKDIKKVYYKGNIWDIETEPYHTILIRRNNRIMWSGNSTSYRINVAADIIEGTQGAFDMQRLALNYTKKRVVKRFEITKDSFKNYKDILILEPIHNASATYVTSDVGDSAATEITVFGKINNKYQLVYNITTYRLSLTKELPELMEYIFRKVEGNFMAVDSTIMGKPVYEILADRLNEKILDEKGNITKIIKRVYWVAFNEDIVTGIQKDDKGYALKDRGGNILEKKEPALHFSVMRLQQLFYDRRFDIPDDDYKFELQFSSYVSIISGNRVVYDSTISEDHYVQSFEVFALLEWLTDGLKEVMEIKEPTKTLAGIFNFK